MLSAVSPFTEFRRTRFTMQIASIIHRTPLKVETKLFTNNNNNNNNNTYTSCCVSLCLFLLYAFILGNTYALLYYICFRLTVKSIDPRAPYLRPRMYLCPILLYNIILYHTKISKCT